MDGGTKDFIGIMVGIFLIFVVITSPITITVLDYYYPQNTTSNYHSSYREIPTTQEVDEYLNNPLIKERVERARIQEVSDTIEIDSVMDSMFTNLKRIELYGDYHIVIRDDMYRESILMPDASHENDKVVPKAVYDKVAIGQVSSKREWNGFLSQSDSLTTVYEKFITNKYVDNIQYIFVYGGYTKSIEELVPNNMKWTSMDLHDKWNTILNSGKFNTELVIHKNKESSVEDFLN